MLRRTVVWASFLIMVSCGVVYVVNSFLYLTPPNPVKAHWLPLIMGLAHPLFAQNWHLFAPDPIRSNYVLTVRCHGRAGTTPWLDATQSLLARHHRTRTSPMSRLLRVHQNAIRLALGLSFDEWRQFSCRRDPHSATCRESPGTGAQRDAGTYLLRRSASAVCDRVVGPGAADAVQALILVHTPPPWSRRDMPSSEGMTRFIRLPWAAYLPAGKGSQ
jgi:hypothetical protein